MKLGRWPDKLDGHPTHAADMPSGVFGPAAITYLAHTLKFTQLAKPRTVFYPIRYTNTHGPLTAGWIVTRRLTTETIGIHLWRHCLQKPSTLRPPNNSDIARIEPVSFLNSFIWETLNFRVESSPELARFRKPVRRQTPGLRPSP